MPPRHNYWTILFGGQPTAFRAATQEELLPTFKQIQGKHADAVMMWFARGKLWRSEEEARAAFDRPRFDRPRGPLPESQNRGQKPPWRDRPQGDRSRGPKPDWEQRDPRTPRPNDPRSGEGGPPGGRRGEWQNRGPDENRKTEHGRQKDFRGPKPPWRDRPPGDRPRGLKPEWKQRDPRDPKPGWLGPPKPPWRDKRHGDRPRGSKPEWQNRGPKPAWREKPRTPRADGPPKSDAPATPKPGEGGRGRDWRPGGAHKDPRDRFKVPREVKRARFKDKLRRDRTNPRPPRKKKDEE